MINSIKIIEDNKINSSFVKANAFLYNKYKEEFTKSTDQNQLLCSLWDLNFNAKLIEENNLFKEAIFRTESDLTLFVFKFN
jgi:hypothetical protein